MGLIKKDGKVKGKCLRPKRQTTGRGNYKYSGIGKDGTLAETGQLPYFYFKKSQFLYYLMYQFVLCAIQSRILQSFPQCPLIFS